MAKVYKYNIESVVELPKGSTILSVQSKCDGNFIYALVPDNVTETEKHYFIVVPTGLSFDFKPIQYIGSVIEGDYFIYHVFEVEPPEVARR